MIRNILQWLVRLDLPIQDMVFAASKVLMEQIATTMVILIVVQVSHKVEHLKMFKLMVKIIKCSHFVQKVEMLKLVELVKIQVMLKINRQLP